MQAKLALIVPPPIVAAAAAGLMWLIQHIGYSIAINSTLKLAICYTLVALGLGLGLSGILSFKKAQTTVNPHRPEQSSTLVQSGIYQFSRNPMYLGLLILLGAWGIFLANVPALLMLPCFVVYINQFQIKPEEHFLEARFKEAFITYKQKVRRWL